MHPHRGSFVFVLSEIITAVAVKSEKIPNEVCVPQLQCTDFTSTEEVTDVKHRNRYQMS